jgi:uncharacterized membrane protein YhaH (DUF805 family)
MQMNFPQAIASGFTKYFTFSGRASRSEYWYWVLFVVLGELVAVIVDGVVFQYEDGVFGSVFYLAVILPWIAIQVRRLHDIDLSGWWILLNVVPIIGLYMIVLQCTRGTQGANRFGPDPLGIDDKVVEVF